MAWYAFFFLHLQDAKKLLLEGFVMQISRVPRNRSGQAVRKSRGPPPTAKRYDTRLVVARAGQGLPGSALAAAWTLG